MKIVSANGPQIQVEDRKDKIFSPKRSRPVCNGENVGFDESADDLELLSNNTGRNFVYGDIAPVVVRYSARSKFRGRRGSVVGLVVDDIIVFQSRRFGLDWQEAIAVRVKRVRN